MNVGPIFAQTVRHFFPDLNDWMDQLPDARLQCRVTYPRRLLAWYGVLLFVGKLGSRRQLDYKYREADTACLGNISRLAQLKVDLPSLPCNDTLDDYLAGVGVEPLARLRGQMIHRLTRMRVLDACRLQGRLVVAIDGTGILSFREKHCEYCLSSKCGEKVIYSHKVVEAKILGPAETVLSLGTAFIDNRHLGKLYKEGDQEKYKQDCELKAMERLMPEIRNEFPQLKICLSGDALCACGRFFQMAKDNNAAFVTVFKPGRLPTLYEEFQTLLSMSEGNQLTIWKDGWEHQYRWVDELPYKDSEGREWKLKAIDYKGYGPKGEKSEWSWLVSPDLEVSKKTVQEVAWQGGRARWREENEGFNVQKNSGLNLEHAYSEKAHFGAYYMLLQIAHLLLQMVEKGSLLRKLAEQAGKASAVALLGSLKNIAEFLVESVRNLVWPDKAFAPSGGQIRLDSG